jgi:hypothetical protein
MAEPCSVTPIGTAPEAVDITLRPGPEEPTKAATTARTVSITIPGRIETLAKERAQSTPGPIRVRRLNCDGHHDQNKQEQSLATPSHPLLPEDRKIDRSGFLNLTMVGMNR